MKYQILTPFRTVFNLDTDMAVQDYSSTHGLIAAACRRLNEQTDLTVHSTMPAPIRSFRKFNSLGDDFQLFSSSPVAIIDLPEEQVRGLAYVLDASAAQHGLVMPAEQHVGVIRDAKVLVFDNTISLLSCNVEINLQAFVNVTDLDQVDAITVHFSDEVCGSLGAPAVELFLKSILAESRNRKIWPHAKALVRTGKVFTAFDDVAEMKFPKWDSAVSPLIWSQRTVFLEASEAGIVERVLQISRVSNAERASIAGKDSWNLVRGGTCIFFNDPTVAEFLKVAPTVQYFTALFYALNDSLRRSYSRLSAGMSNSEFDKEALRSGHVTALYEFLICEFNDYVHVSLQAHRKEFADELIDVYQLKEIVSNLKVRQEAVTSRLQQLLDSRNGRFQRGAKAALGGLAGISVVDLLFSIGRFSRNSNVPDVEAVPGPIALMQSLPLDLTVGLAMTSLLVGSIIYYFWKF